MIRQQKLNGRMLGKCWMNSVFKRFQRNSTFSRTNKNVESMLNESLNQFKFDAIGFQQASNIFYVFNYAERPIQTPPTFGSTKRSTHVEANIETVYCKRTFIRVQR